MMECPRCGYITNRKDLFASHINRLVICEATISNCSLDELKLCYEKKDKLHKCECGTSYTHKSSFYRHKKICSGSGQIAENNNSTIINVNNVNIQNNITNNIYILPFTEKNTDYITNDFYSKCLKRTNIGLIELLKHIYFNPEHKENQNIRIKNKKLSLIEKYNGEKWEYDDKEKILTELFKSGYELIDQYYYENESDLHSTFPRSILNNINEFMSSVDKLDKSVMKPMFKDIYLLIINNSYMLLKHK